MKLIFSILVLAISTNIFAAESAGERIEKIEAERNVKCEYKSHSIPICIGMERRYQTCRISYTFTCTGQENLEVKIRMKEYYDYFKDKRNWKPTSVKIKKI